MKKFLSFTLALSMFASACSDSVETLNDEQTENFNVSMKLSLQDWRDLVSRTRAGKDYAYPISLFYVTEGQTNVKLLTTIESGEANFSFSVPNGNYNIYAALGLPKNLIPNNINDAVKIPKNTDFSVASTSFSVNNGSCEPIELEAKHKMAWLEMKITDVPSSINELRLYIKGLYEEYIFNNGWKDPIADLKEKYSLLEVSKVGQDYISNEIIFPSSNQTTVEFIAEVTTSSGYTKLMKGSAPKPLSAGTHMSITASLSSLNVIEENVTMSEWTKITETGTISDFAGLNIGDQYFGQAATVVKITETAIFVMPHKPMTVTLSDVKSWSDFKNVSYNESPKINVNRWSLVNVNTANEIGQNLQNVGWDKFASTIEASGNSISQNAENLIIAYDQDKKKFWHLDCNTLSVKPVTDESGEFLLYPIGVINLLQ